MKSVGAIAFILTALFRGVLTGGGIDLSFDSMDEISARAGENLTITVFLRSSTFEDYQLIEVVHRDILTLEETVLGSLQDYTTVLTSAVGYDMSVTNVSEFDRTLNFFIKSLRVQDDGDVIVNWLSTTGATNATIRRRLIVVVSPESVTIKFGNLANVDFNSTQEVGVSPGNITVYCIVEESNPAITDISIKLNGNDVTLASGPDYELVSATESLYSSNVSAILEIPSNINETQTLTCVAVDHFGEWHTTQLLYSLENSACREQTTSILVWGFLVVVAFLWNTQ